MVLFNSDYTEGAHPKIMELMMSSNMEQTGGYGMDAYCDKARALIRQQCGREDIDVQFLVGGTQTNLTVIAATLRPHQGVISADTGHINVHETGAVEAAGHKVLPLPSRDGKITAAQIEAAYTAHWNDPVHEHTVQPGIVYLSQPTELGTLYSLEELSAISAVCRRRGLPLYIDGARCGYGLAAPDNDVTLPELARLSDVFYIGGTKVGALLGEAVVFPNPRLCRDFRYMIKRMGGMLAKGRLLGIQFETLFEEGLYFQLGQHAVELALRIRDAFLAAGVELAVCYTLLHREADRDAAETGSRELGLPLHRLAVDLTALPAVMENHRDRCYHCKRVLFRRMWETAQQRALGALAEGANAEDVTAYRPGLQAGAEWGVARPLAAAGLTKKDVRTLARIWGLSCWNRPSSPCLASRFPYDTPLTRPALERVAAGESLLAQAGLVDVRLRCHGDLARIECRPEQAPFLLAQSKTLVPALKGLGFSYITYDLEGFRSGSFDR